MKLLIIIASLGGFVGGIIAADLFIRFLFQQRVTGTGIDLLLLPGRIPLKHIPFANIQEIRRATFMETLRPQNIFKALRFGIYGQGGGIVLLRLREGIKLRFPPDIFKRRLIYIFPYNPDRFIQEVLQHLPGQIRVGP